MPCGAFLNLFLTYKASPQRKRSRKSAVQWEVTSLSMLTRQLRYIRNLRKGIGCGRAFFC